MASEKDPETSPTGIIHNLLASIEDFLSLANLVHNPNLHVIDEKRTRGGSANFLECLRDANAVRMLH
jgi:hypothetical protein